MRKILIFGGTGMMGSMLTSYLLKSGCNITITSRKHLDIPNVEVIVFDAENQKIPDVSEFDWIINCIGIIKQRNPSDCKKYYQINSMFPWKLLNKVNLYNKKLIHISSDCIFDGILDGNESYNVYDIPTATDDYGYSKALGEPEGCIVLRTSIIGPSKSDSLGLFEWFRNNKEEIIYGYKHFWSGVTTLELSKVIEKILTNNYYPSRDTKNIYQVSLNESIFKTTLLQYINKIYNLKKTISNKIAENPSHQIINRGLKNNLNELCNIQIKDIKIQLQELKEWEDNEKS